MGLQLLDCVNSIIHKVKEETGKDILLFENNKMASMVEVKTARKEDENHLMAYSPNYTPEINHLIASKAIQILRIYKEEPNNRKMAVAYQEHINNAKMSIALEVNRKPHLQIALNDPSLISTWTISLVNQLISQPVNINIERTIYSEYPDLRDLQKNVISNQFKDFNATLSAEVEGLSPDIIYNSSAIMNYIYLKTMDDITGSEFITQLNYIVKKHKSVDLYNYTNSNLENSIVSDKHIIDYWAKCLNIDQWYTWTDFEDVQGSSSDA